ncbi:MULTISPECIES: LysE family transporter [Pseudomonas]|uniref:LysE family transporter n=1 Tax=Pseudomonas TaxID=286 RepID=UPI0008EEDDA4|nr:MULTISPECIES: LysE family transporter [Pseudomonas]AZD17469.1 Threonine efflux protein [Pseudomonas chlororaphis]MCP1483295.1 RhtB (resistance to homoserine/threonine) family protein [Pseudomonas chlororaphis]MCP1596348.1 RhtB (resistance to homoserine/threonine) family protein [Pseudomonas chlororaphis]RON78556.1 amino acid transporter [Pseudomonas chlororaphis]WDG51795.1 LysE family transporter [Pseudomonas chlororaphis]
MTELLVVITITILAVLSPGPDFAMVTRNSLVLSRRHGVFTALGIGLGVMLHIGYTLLGVGLLVKESLLLFSVLKIAGALYLVYLGIGMLRSRAVEEEVTVDAPRVSAWAALRTGFLTNALNPKTMIFVVSLFMQVMQPGTAPGVQIGYGAIIVLAHVLWFVAVALFFSAPGIRARLMAYKRRIDQLFGVLLVGFGVLLSALSLRS